MSGEQIGTAAMMAAYATGLAAAVAGWLLLSPIGPVAGGIAAVAMFITTTYAAGQPAAKLAVHLDRGGWFR